MERGYRADRGANPQLTRLNLRLDLPFEVRRLLDLYVIRLSKLQGETVTTSDAISAMLCYLMMALAPEILGERQKVRVDQVHSLLKTLDPKDLEKLDVFRALTAPAAPSGTDAHQHTRGYDASSSSGRPGKAAKRRKRRKPRAGTRGGGAPRTTTQTPPGSGTSA